MFAMPFPTAAGSRMQSAPSVGRMRNQASSAYSQVGVHTDVNGASPHQLVVLLFDGCTAAITRARGALQAGDIVAMGTAIRHAARIVEEGLKAPLNRSEGGPLATNLHDLYSYITVRLTHANLHADDQALDECARLIVPLREAWMAIGNKAPATPAAIK